MRARLAVSVLANMALAAVACTGAPPGPTATPTSAHPPSPTPAATLPAPPTIGTLLVAMVRQPLAMAVRTGDPSIYIVSKGGRVWALRGGTIDPTPVLDLSGQVSKGREQGLLGMAFSPSGAFAYLSYTDRQGD